MSKTNEIKWGSFLSYLQMVLGVIIGITYSRFMIRLLGQSEYGLYQMAAATISMLSVLNLGFNASYVKFFAKYKQIDDNESIYRLNGLFLTVFTIIGLIALLCGMYLSAHLELVFDTGLTEAEYALAKTLMTLLIVNLSISFPMSVFSTIISANERFIFLKIVGMVITVIGPLVNVPLLLLGFRSVGLVVSTLVFSLITDVLYIYYVIVKLKNKFFFSKFEKSLFSSLFKFSFFIAINIIVDQINNGIDRVLLGRFKGAVSVAVYSVGATLYRYYMQISTAVSSVFTPKIHRIFNSYDDIGQRNFHLSELMIKVGRIQFLILALVSSGLCFFGDTFIRFWIGDGYTDSYYVMLLLVLPSTIPLIQNIGIEIQRAANKHHFRSIIYLFMSVCNLLLSIYLCQLYGAVGAAIGTAVSFILANGIIMNLYYYKGLGLDIPLFWKTIGRMGLGMIPAAIAGGLIRYFAPMTTVWHMLLFILLYTLVYFASVWMMSMNKMEKDLVLSPVRKIIKLRMEEQK